MKKKVNNTKPSEKQKKAVNNIIENRGNVSKSMRDAGYTDATAKNPSNLTDSKGFEQLCVDAGLTDQFLIECLEEDIRLKPQNRKGELELGVKMRGLVTEKIDHTSKGERMTMTTFLTELNGNNKEDIKK